LSTAAEVLVIAMGYVARCRARGCRLRASVALRKVDRAGGFIREIELCDRHTEVVIERERASGMKVRRWQQE
jgi:hypothetical protein